MRAEAVLCVYRACFVALLMLASVQTALLGHEGGHAVAALAMAEMAGGDSELLRAVIRRLGREAVFDEALRSALGEWYVDAIDTAAAQIRVVGDRYPEAMQRMIDR